MYLKHSDATVNIIVLRDLDKFIVVGDVPSISFIWIHICVLIHVCSMPKYRPKKYRPTVPDLIL
jgi:hypothetical protein